jgi:hypothetical protein
MATDLREAGADARPLAGDSPQRAWRLPAVALILACGLVFGAAFLLGRHAGDDDAQPSRGGGRPSAPAAAPGVIALRDPAPLPALRRPARPRRRQPARRPKGAVAPLTPAPEPPALTPVSDAPVAAPDPPTASPDPPRAAPAPPEPIAVPGPAVTPDPPPPAPDPPPVALAPEPDPAPASGGVGGAGHHE